MVSKTTIRKIFYFSYFSGFFPLTQDELKFKISNLRFCIGLILVACLMGESVVMCKRQSLDTSTQYLLSIVDIFLNMCANSLPIVSFVNSYLKMTSLNEYIGAINGVDKSLLKIGVWPYIGSSISKFRIFVYLIVYIIMASANSVCLFYDEYNWIDSFTYQYYYIPMIPIMIVVDQTVSLTNLIGRRFVVVKNSLTKNSSSALFVESLVDIQDVLIDACDHLKKFTEHQIVVIFATTIWSEVFSFYRMVEIFKVQKNVSARIFFSINICTWLILYGMFSWNIISEIGSIVKQVKEFDILLFQIMMEDRSEQIFNNKKMRCHLALKRDVDFLPCGLFIVDYPLLHSIVAAITGYLVIMVQFGKPVPNVNVGSASDEYIYDVNYTDI